jgi:uncharacterized membrane protein YwzB
MIDRWNAIEVASVQMSNFLKEESKIVEDFWISQENTHKKMRKKSKNPSLNYLIVFIAFRSLFCAISNFFQTGFSSPKL